MKIFGREVKTYKAQLIADETADCKSGELIAERVAPMSYLPKEESDLVDFCVEEILDGCTEDFITELLEMVENGLCQDRIYNYYIIDENGEEVEDFSMSISLSELLEAYLEELREEAK